MTPFYTRDRAERRRGCKISPLDAGNCEVWPLEDGICFDIPEDTPANVILDWQRFASEYLWMMTGRRIGPSCRTTVRPCRKTCFDGFFDLLRFPGGVANSTGGWIPYLVAGEFRNATLCGCTHNCHCGPELCQIELPGPIYDITDVDLNGVTVDPASYQVVDGRFLRRVGVGADECWPTCQDLTKRSGDADTFSVTYRTGLTIPVLGTAAVTILTAHLIRGCSGGCGCGVGTRQNLARLQRQGVELEFASTSQVFTDGRTGIEAVDMFIRAMNPHGVMSPLRVLSPDAPKYPEIWR